MWQGVLLVGIVALVGLWQILECCCDGWPKPLVGLYRRSPLFRKTSDRDLRGMVGLIGAIDFAGAIAMFVFFMRTTHQEMPGPSYCRGGTAHLPLAVTAAPIVISLWWFLEAATGRGLIVRTLAAYYQPKNAPDAVRRVRVALSIAAAVVLAIGAYLMVLLAPS